MALESRLELKLTQKLILTPQLQLAIKLLQMPQLELSQALTQELTENPFLEEIIEEREELSREEMENIEKGTAGTGMSREAVLMGITYLPRQDMANGRIRDCGPAAEVARRLPADVPVTAYANALITAGFVDAHVHYPQLPIIGAGGLPLIAETSVILSL